MTFSQHRCLGVLVKADKLYEDSPDKFYKSTEDFDDWKVPLRHNFHIHVYSLNVYVLSV